MEWLRDRDLERMILYQFLRAGEGGKEGGREGGKREGGRERDEGGRKSNMHPLISAFPPKHPIILVIC